MPRIPFVVIGGFLGAGKTTLLNHLLRQPQMDGSAVLINEFGAVGVDHMGDIVFAEMAVHGRSPGMGKGKGLSCGVSEQESGPSI